jgi:branched-chain amino acid transport system ATP-binding protein
VFGCADRIVVLHRGQVLATGSAREIRGHPRVREIYLGAHPEPGALPAVSPVFDTVPKIEVA